MGAAIASDYNIQKVKYVWSFFVVVDFLILSSMLSLVENTQVCF